MISLPFVPGRRDAPFMPLAGNDFPSAVLASRSTMPFGVAPIDSFPPPLGKGPSGARATQGASCRSFRPLSWPCEPLEEAPDFDCGADRAARGRVGCDGYYDISRGRFVNRLLNVTNEEIA